MPCLWLCLHRKRKRNNAAMSTAVIMFQIPLMSQIKLKVRQYDFQTFKIKTSVNISNNYNPVFIALSAKGAN